jgi:hypothetical protein
MFFQDSLPSAKGKCWKSVVRYKQDARIIRQQLAKMLKFPLRAGPRFRLRVHISTSVSSLRRPGKVLISLLLTLSH